jgi:phospholipid/cholesterol/gamma-HCH transport system substrate-binding protein
MDERDKKTELLVGLFLTVGLLFLGMLILQFSSVRELFKDTYALTLHMKDGSGVREGTPVLFGGLKVGKVPRRPQHNADYTGVIIDLEIYNTEKIPTNAKFGIGTAGLMGDTYIEVRPTAGRAETYYKDGDVVPKESVAGASGLDALQDTAADLSKKVDDALGDLRTLIGDVRVSVKKINEGALSDESTDSLKASFKRLENVMTRLDEKTLGEQTATDVKEAIASFKEAAETLKGAVKKLDPALEKVDSVMANADKAVVSADKAMKSLETNAAELGKIRNDLKSGPGLLPALLHDRNLRNEFTMLVTNLRQRGVLWYKDKAGAAQAEGSQGRQEQERERSKIPGRKR